MPRKQFRISYEKFLYLLLIVTFLAWFTITYLVRLQPNSHQYSITLHNTTCENQEDISAWDRWDNITGFPTPIVPNIVHFIKFQQHELTFVQLVVILSAWCHQRPDRLIIHCDCDDLSGPYWEKVKNLSGVEVRRIRSPTKVFGKPISKRFNVHHAGDIARIAVLRQYGGIALDLDTYVIRSLDEFRRFECTIAWPERANIGCQVIISHKNSRFLQLYSDSYHAYNGSSWYYNAGQLPTRILELLPHTVHRVPWKLGIHDLRHKLYHTNWKEWRSYYAAHLLIRHEKKSSVDFNEHNIRNFSYTFGEMARQVLFGTADLIRHNKEVLWDYKQCRFVKDH